MDSPYARELQVAFAALTQAAQLSRAVLAEAAASSEKGLGTVAKDDLSPVTVADFAIQALLAATVRAAFPEDRCVGEESAAALRANPILLGRVWDHLRNSSGNVTIPESSDHACDLIDQCAASAPGKGNGEEGGRAWVFDPIDGTQNFVTGGVYAINVALLDGATGQQLLGAVACPNLSPDLAPEAPPVLDSSLDPTGQGRIAFAVRGHGTHVRTVTPTTGEITIRAIPRHAETATSLRLVTSTGAAASGLADVHVAAAAALQIPLACCDLLPWVLRWAALGLGLGGGANTTFWAYKKRERRGKAWDHAGAMLLFEEVGGKITDVDGKPIDLAAGRLLTGNYGFVAAPESRHAEVVKVVQDAVRRDGRVEMPGA